MHRHPRFRKSRDFRYRKSEKFPRIFLGKSGKFPGNFPEKSENFPLREIIIFDEEISKSSMIDIYHHRDLRCADEVSKSKISKTFPIFKTFLILLRDLGELMF